MPKELNIAIISIHSCPLGTLGGRDSGGMNVYVKEVAQELGRKGHKVDIYTMAHQPQHKAIMSLGENVRLIHLEPGSEDELPKVAIYVYIQRLACGIESFRKSQDIDYDLIHSHYWLSGLVGGQLQTWWHIPHATMFHTLAAAKNSTGIGEDETELRLESEREVVRGCNLIIAATYREKKELVRSYGADAGKIAVVPCGVNHDLFRPVNKGTARKELGLNHHKVILFVGRIEPLKGLERLVQAFTLIRDERPPLLMIVGGDDHSENQVQTLRQMTRDLHIEDRVIFVGSVVQRKLPLFYSAADLCVIPSYYESFGMVALESLACGTPILATNVGGMKNIIREAEMGRIARDNTPQNLAREMTGLLSATNNQVRHINRRRAGTAQFTWSNIADRLLREYRGLLPD